MSTPNNCTIECMKLAKIIAVSSTTLVVLGLSIVPMEMVFETLIGVLLLLLYVVSFVSSLYAILLYGEPPIERGNKHREKPIGLLVLVDALLFVFFLLYVAYYLEILSPVIIAITLISLVGFLLYFFLAYRFNYVIIDEDGLQVNYLLMMKPTTIKYEEIEAITFGYLMNTFKLHVKGHRVFIDVFLQNADQILNEIYRHTKPEIHKKAFDDLGKFMTMSLVQRNRNYLRYFDQR